MRNPLLILALLAVFLLGYAVGHIQTILGLEIETDGNGDSAIVTTVGGWQYLYGINGHDLNGNGEMLHDLGRTP